LAIRAKSSHAGAVPEREIEAWLRRHVDIGAGTLA
jgi:hypothetical protein